MELEDNPQLVRDIQILLRKPEFIRLKRHVFVETSEMGETSGGELADKVGTYLRDSLMDFSLEMGP